MNEISTYKALIEKELNLLDFSLEPSELFEPIQYILSLGGKRLRPVLALMGCALFGGKPEDALHQGLAVEVFHNFTLLHDDIMDEAPLRRGMATVHEKWNPNIAILSGDAMMIMAYQHLIHAPSAQLPSLMEHFNTTALEVCIGQQYDMNFEGQEQVAIEDYIHMISLKTSVLLGCALKLGAIRAGASNESAQQIYEFGKNIGIAFQLQDDILDVYADPEKFGKQVGGDIIANKKTYLLITALKKAKGIKAEELTSWILKETFDKEQKVKEVKAIYDELGVREMAETEMKKYFDKGMQSMSSLTGVNAEVKDQLCQLAESLMVREL